MAPERLIQERSKSLQGSRRAANTVILSQHGLEKFADGCGIIVKLPLPGLEHLRKIFRGHKIDRDAAIGIHLFAQFKKPGNVALDLIEVFVAFHVAVSFRTRSIQVEIHPNSLFA